MGSSPAVDFKALVNLERLLNHLDQIETDLFLQKLSSLLECFLNGKTLAVNRLFYQNQLHQLAIATLSNHEATEKRTRMIWLGSSHSHSRYSGGTTSNAYLYH